MSVVPVPVNVFPVGVVIVMDTLAPPTGFPPWSITLTVRYSKDFCVLTVGRAVNEAVSAGTMTVEVEAVVTDVVALEVAVLVDVVEIDAVVVAEASVVVVEELVRDGVEVDKLDVDVVEAVGADEAEEVVDVEDIAAFHSEVPPATDGAPPPTTTALGEREGFWRFPWTPQHEREVEVQP